MSVSIGKKYIYALLRRFGYDVARLNTRGFPERRRLSLGQLVAIHEAEITLEESRFLFELVNGVSSSGTIIEVGTLFGSSTRVIGLAKGASTSLLTVDNYSWNPLGLTAEEHQWLTAQILNAMKIPGLQIVKADKNEFYESSAVTSPDLVFLDAGHSYDETAKDIAFAKRVHAAIICGHDYDPEKWPGVVRAVDEAGGPRRLAGSLWVL